jgi:hypothetical protein
MNAADKRLLRRLLMWMGPVAAAGGVWVGLVYPAPTVFQMPGDPVVSTVVPTSAPAPPVVPAPVVTEVPVTVTDVPAPVTVTSTRDYRSGRTATGYGHRNPGADHHRAGPRASAGADCYSPADDSDDARRCAVADHATAGATHGDPACHYRIPVRLFRRYAWGCPYRCGVAVRGWTRRAVRLELDRHTAVCRWRVRR